MRERITMQDIQRRLDYFNQHYGTDLSLGGAYGGYRIEAEGGARDISPRGTKRECYTFICAMLRGVDLYRDPAPRVRQQRFMTS